MIHKICKKMKADDLRGLEVNPPEIKVFAHGALCIAVSVAHFNMLEHSQRPTNKALAAAQATAWSASRG
ncbi:MAG: hypothetical protein ABGY95_09965 [Rubritalea sp.]|uniref:hypothetical protein n=1 Tax=Rubritalea sp. TaxID=2109375 RepID=UPI003241ECA5